MNTWIVGKRFDEISLLDKKNYSSLNMEDITHVDNRHATKVLKYDIMICMHKVIHYCFQIYLRILETNILKYMNLSCIASIIIWIRMASFFKKTEVKLELLTD